MFSSVSSLNSVSTKNSKRLVYNTFLNYTSTNQYTDSLSQVWTNYVYLSGTSANAVNFNNFTGTVCVLAIGGGGAGGLGNSSGGTAGSASQIVLSNYTLSNFSDSINITVAPTTKQTAAVVAQPNGGNSTVAFSTNSGFSLTSIGGAGGCSGQNGQNGGCSGNAGRAASLIGGSCTANYIGGITTNIGTNSLYAIGYGSSAGKSSWSNVSYGWGGNGCGGMATDPGAVISSSCGGTGMKLPTGYGISTYYYYCGGGGGGSNQTVAGGIAYAGGGCGGGNTSVSFSVRDSATPTGYGAINDSGTSGVLVSSTSQNAVQSGGAGNYAYPGNGVLGSGGGSGSNLSLTRGWGGSGIIIISVKN